MARRLTPAAASAGRTVALQRAPLPSGRPPQRATARSLVACVVVAALGSGAVSALLFARAELREQLTQSVASLRDGRWAASWRHGGQPGAGGGLAAAGGGLSPIVDGSDDGERPDAGDGDEDGDDGAGDAAAEGALASRASIGSAQGSSGDSVAAGAPPRLDAPPRTGQPLRGYTGHRGGHRRARDVRLLQPPAHAALPGFGPHADIPRERNAPARAYAALLAAQAALPPAARSYLLVRAESGWGNKVRALVAGFKLALGTGRTMLVDDAFVRPIFPDMFAPPFAPWLSSGVASGARAGGRRTLSDATADLDAWLSALAAANATRALVRRNAHGNAEFACWAARHALGPCVDAAATRVLVLETNQPVSALVMASADVRPALDAALGAGGVGDPALLDRLVYAALFGAPRPALTAAVAAAKDAMGWDRFPLRVGVHLRLFVDSRVWRMRSAKIRPAWWECVHRAVAEAQAAAGVGTNGTLIVLASDKPQARPGYAAHMGAWGTVRWVRSVGAFVNSRDSHDAAAVRGVLVEWTLLSDADAVVGTVGSSFSTAAALRSAIPRVVGSLRGSQCGAEERTVVT